jgi:uncharacterized protein
MIEVFKRRRTQYSLGTNLMISADTIDALIRESVRLAPSPFHSQSSRAVILFGDENQRLWNIVRDELATILSAEVLEPSLVKIDRLAAGVGTVLFFEDQQTIHDLQQEFPRFSEHFPAWSEQSGGMAQFAVWTTLANASIGASLQHYNPLIDAKVQQTWDIPKSWKLRAQMPFGSNEAPILEKGNFFPDLLRFRTYGEGAPIADATSPPPSNVVSFETRRRSSQVTRQ